MALRVAMSMCPLWFRLRYLTWLKVSMVLGGSIVTTFYLAQPPRGFHSRELSIYWMDWHNILYRH